MEARGTEDVAKKCGACGKTDGNALKRCTCCKRIDMVVYYCGRDCQKAHRTDHKKEVKQRKSFNLWNPRPRESCPLCMLPFPLQSELTIYNACCDVKICVGCWDENIRVILESNREKSRLDRPSLELSCPFCRAPFHNADDSDLILKERYEEMMKRNDPHAFFRMAYKYEHGTMFVTKDEKKTLALFHEATDLGDAAAPDDIARCYSQGKLGLKMDCKKEIEYSELAASRGHVTARHRLGACAIHKGDLQLAKRHFCIAAEAGLTRSLDALQSMFNGGFMSSDELMEVNRAYKKATDEVKSENREIAAMDKDRLRG